MFKSRREHRYPPPHPNPPPACLTAASNTRYTHSTRAHMHVSCVVFRKCSCACMHACTCVYVSTGMLAVSGPTQHLGWCSHRQIYVSSTRAQCVLWLRGPGVANHYTMCTCVRLGTAVRQARGNAAARGRAVAESWAGGRLSSSRKHQHGSQRGAGLGKAGDGVQGH